MSANPGNVGHVPDPEPQATCRPSDLDAHRQLGPAPHRLSETVIWLLGRASLRGHQLTRERLAGDGVGKWHYAVLAALAEFGPAAQAELGRRLGIDRSDMVAVLNALEEHGYLSRAPDPADRRRNSVVPTEAGLRALDRFDRLIVEADDTLTVSFSPAERELLIRLLERIVFSAE
jgi:MarR family transcriptional regulator, lower aerobic nicotinate degradation pathway regulator